jgi:hypothetical protein
MKRMISPILQRPWFFLALLAAVLLCASPVAAQGFDFGTLELGNVLNLGQADPREIAVRLINLALECLAVITLVVILWGGFQFLISGGNDEKMKRAGATIRNAIIGLVIVMLSWTIVRFVITEFVTAIDDEGAAEDVIIPNPVPSSSSGSSSWMKGEGGRGGDLTEVVVLDPSSLIPHPSSLSLPDTASQMYS